MTVTTYLVVLLTVSILLNIILALWLYSRGIRVRQHAWSIQNADVTIKQLRRCVAQLIVSRLKESTVFLSLRLGIHYVEQEGFLSCIRIMSHGSGTDSDPLMEITLTLFPDGDCEIELSQRDVRLKDPAYQISNLVGLVFRIENQLMTLPASTITA